MLKQTSSFRNASVNKVVISKVHTLHPEPNTLLGMYRETSSPAHRAGKVGFVQTLSGNSFTGINWEGIWKKVPFFHLSSSSSSFSVSLRALLGGHSHTVLVGKVAKTQLHVSSGGVSALSPRLHVRRPSCEDCYASSPCPSSAAQQSPSQRKEGGGGLCFGLGVLWSPPCPHSVSWLGEAG